MADERLTLLRGVLLLPRLTDEERELDGLLWLTDEEREPPLKLPPPRDDDELWLTDELWLPPPPP